MLEGTVFGGSGEGILATTGLTCTNIATNLVSIGAGVFTGSGAHEVQIEHTGAGNSIIRINLDNDLVADFRLVVQNSLLDGGDLIL